MQGPESNTIAAANPTQPAALRLNRRLPGVWMRCAGLEADMSEVLRGTCRVRASQRGAIYTIEYSAWYPGQALPTLARAPGAGGVAVHPGKKTRAGGAHARGSYDCTLQRADSTALR